MRKIFLIILMTTIGFVGHSQQKKEFKIAVIVDYLSPEFNLFIDDLKSEVSALAGENATVVLNQDDIYSGNYNFDTIKDLYLKLSASDVDVILVSGEVAHSYIKTIDTFETPTILFGFYDLENLSVEKTKSISNISNFSYVVLSQTYEEDLTQLKELSYFSNLGIVVDEHNLKYGNPDQYAKPICEKLGVNYRFIPFSNASDILNNLDGIDAIYFANGFLLKDAEVKAIAKRLIELQIPSFTSTSLNHVKNGLLATNKILENNNQFIRRMGLMIEDVINGDNLSNSKIYSKFESNLTMNIGTARKLNIPIKLSLIANTNFTGDFDNSYAAKDYNLIEVMKEVVSENLGLIVSRKNLELQSQEVKLAKSNYLPNLSANATASFLDENVAEISNGGNPENVTSGNLSLTQAIYSESATANISIQKSLEKAAVETYNSEELTAVFNVMQAYYNALSLKANLQIRYTNLQLTKKNLQIANQNFEAGQSGKADVLRFKSERANNTQLLLEGVSNLEQGYNALNLLLNNPMDYDIDIEDVTLEDKIFTKYRYHNFIKFIDNPISRKNFVSFLYEEAMRNNPDLKSIDYNLEALNRSVKLYGSGRFVPTIGLKGQYNYEFSRSGSGTAYPPGFGVPPDGYYSVGLNVSIPLIDQNLKNINKKTAIIQSDQLHVKREEFELNLKRQINDGILKVVNEISNIEISGITLNAAEESLDLIQTSYSSGAVTIVELLDAQNNFLEAKLNRVNATYNYLLATAEIERIVGIYILLNTEEQNNQIQDRFNQYILNKQ